MKNKKDIDEVLKSYECLSKADTIDWVQTAEEQACFYRMERAAERYAKKFFCLLSGRDIEKYETNLPIVFKSNLEIIYTGLHGAGYIQGQFYKSTFTDKQSAIYIVLPVRSKMSYLHKSLKSTIRHELIHYYLFLHDLPYKDNEGLFWAYNYIFDAEAYDPMSESDSVKYNRFIEIYERDGKNASYNDLQTLAEAIMLDDDELFHQWEMLIKWRNEMSKSLEK